MGIKASCDGNIYSRAITSAACVVRTLKRENEMISEKSYEQRRQKQSRRGYTCMHRAVGLGPLLNQDPGQLFFSWKKRREVELTGESKATIAFCGLQNWAQTVIVGPCSTVYFCCLLAARHKRSCSKLCSVTRNQEKGCGGRRLCCLPQLSLLIFSWAGSTIHYGYYFFC